MLVGQLVVKQLYIRMKKQIVIIMAFFAFAINALADNLSIADVSLTQGEAKRVEVNLTNTTTNIVGFQFDLTLPEGVTPVTSSSGAVTVTATSRLGGSFTLRGKSQGNNIYRFVYLSTSGTGISGNSGSIFSISFTTSETATCGTKEATISNVTITGKDGSEISPGGSSFNITLPHTFANGTCSVCGTAEQVVDADTDISKLANVIYLENCECVVGQQATLSLKMKNSVAITGFQCDLYLPEGISVAKDEDDFNLINLSTVRTTPQKTNFFDSAMQSDGSVRIMCSSTKNYTFSGNDGEVATIVLDIDGEMNEGDYPILLRNIVLSDATSKTYEVDYVKSTISVLKYTLGDANNDGKINVGDFTAIAGYIMGTPPSGFIEKAADVNSDGKINVGDLTAVATLILYGTLNPITNAKVIGGK